jgi:hypothetical protein
VVTSSSSSKHGATNFYRLSKRSGA